MLIYNKHSKTFNQGILIFTPCKKFCIHFLLIGIPLDIVCIDIDVASHTYIEQFCCLYTYLD